MTKETANSEFWPDGVRLVISVSMQFEAGGQPPKGTDSPFPKVDFPDSVPSDAAANTWFAYGYREGIPRMLDLWDRHGVKVTSHMIGEAAHIIQNSPGKLLHGVMKQPATVRAGAPNMQ
jgi:peptidoglycan/xylan/chitin deacetylase (PgdA/CDA1 family)